LRSNSECPKRKPGTYALTSFQSWDDWTAQSTAQQRHVTPFMAEVGKKHWCAYGPIPASMLFLPNGEVTTKSIYHGNHHQRGRPDPRRGNMVVIDHSKHESDEAHHFPTDAKCEQPPAFEKPKIWSIFSSFILCNEDLGLGLSSTILWADTHVLSPLNLQSKTNPLSSTSIAT
jgi:hypothetical protein